MNIIYNATGRYIRFLNACGPLGTISLYWEDLEMWDRYLKVGITLLLDILNDAGERSRHRKMILKVFNAIAAAHAQDAEFRKVAKEAFN